MTVFVKKKKEGVNNAEMDWEHNINNNKHIHIKRRERELDTKRYASEILNWPLNMIGCRLFTNKRKKGDVDQMGNKGQQLRGHICFMKLYSQQIYK